MKKQLTILLAFVLVFISVLLTSCASIMHGTDQEVSVSSTPEGASVSIKTLGGIDVLEGTTPFIANLEREDDYRVVVSKEGYEDNEVILKNTLTGWFWGNLLCGGVIGIIIDFSNGAAYELEPDAIHVDLVEVKGASNKTEYYLVIKILDDKGELQTYVSRFIEKQNI
jgi:predicted small secreted protein